MATGPPRGPRRSKSFLREVSQSVSQLPRFYSYVLSYSYCKLACVHPGILHVVEGWETRGAADRRPYKVWKSLV